MQPVTARLDEFHRLRRRIVVEHGGRTHVAAQQAHGLAVLEVDGGIEDHGPNSVQAVTRALWHASARNATRRHVRLDLTPPVGSGSSAYLREDETCVNW